MTLLPTTELLRVAPPVYRCAHCFRRHEDHRGLSLICPQPYDSSFEAIPYESHQSVQERDA